MNKGELPNDRKHFLDKFLPKWDYDTDVLLENMHAMRIKEMYNQGYTDLKLFSEVSNMKDTYLLAYLGISDIKTLMNIPANLLFIKRINNPFLVGLQKRLKEGFMKPTKMAFDIAQAISKIQYGILRYYEPDLKGSDLVSFWLYKNVKYTYELIDKPRRLWLFNFCSPSYYNEETGQIVMLFSPSEVKNLVIRNPYFRNDYGHDSGRIMLSLYRTWNNSTLLNDLYLEGSNNTYNPNYDKFVSDWRSNIDRYFNQDKKKVSNIAGGDYINESSSSISNNEHESGHSAMEMLGFMAVANAILDDDGDNGDIDD